MCEDTRIKIAAQQPGASVQQALAFVQDRFAWLQQNFLHAALIVLDDQRPGVLESLSQVQVFDPAGDPSIRTASVGVMRKRLRRALWNRR